MRKGGTSGFSTMGYQHGAHGLVQVRRGGEDSGYVSACAIRSGMNLRTAKWVLVKSRAAHATRTHSRVWGHGELSVHNRVTCTSAIEYVAAPHRQTTINANLIRSIFHGKVARPHAQDATCSSSTP